MILKTGNKNRFFVRMKNNDGGYTFVEVLLAVVIFSLGMVGIFRTLIVSMDRMSLLTTRLYANLILENQITNVERTLRNFNTIPFELNPKEVIDTGSGQVEFDKKSVIEQLPELNDILSIDLTLSWTEKGRLIQLTKSAYISNFKNK
ncbi:MAG: prepilin-type N-terminal cleavage/methylation domain-containing protein [Candidatus Omnitrophota bacterium]